MANTFTSLIDLIYPKKSIFLQADATSPATILGGTWGQIKNGLLMCAGHTTAATVGTSGGSDTIALSQIPSHSHYVTNSQGYHDVSQAQPTSARVISYEWYADSSNGHCGNYTGYEGGGQPFVPAHYAVNVWQRTS